MIGKEAITNYIRQEMPDALVEVTDKTGTMDHYRLLVVSEKFEGVNLLNRQRLVYAALKDPMADGRIHALEIKSQTPEEAGAS